MRKVTTLTGKNLPRLAVAKPGWPDDEVQQKADWRGRLVDALVNRTFDDETLVEMLMAGLDKAHEEGILDAADVCKGVADNQPGARHVASILERSLRSLAQMNAGPSIVTPRAVSDFTRVCDQTGLSEKLRKD